ncbi:cystathionine gamma-synthase 1, chloroplastic [Cinnamomum micranthum f. kanehirae]|uniref:plant cystathionine gamma-synthase n=1 Tax=Cinnamomum micranthum f. kanehirae TaxID=337451 RepID=A0A443NIL0_9MAGN|nr:cystathionine gamma-synthase 1, chloroplastic [Cinnamomum micranthum f. kanehirae]
MKWRKGSIVHFIHRLAGAHHKSKQGRKEEKESPSISISIAGGCRAVPVSLYLNLMAASCCPSTISAYFECRSDPDFCYANPNPKNKNKNKSDRANKSSFRHFSSAAAAAGGGGYGSGGLIFRFPPNFVRQLSIKARRNCSNIGVAQIVAASWSNQRPLVDDDGSVVVHHDDAAVNALQLSPLAPPSSIGTIAVHAGERSGRGIATDAITTPIVNTSAYMFKDTAELIAFKDGTRESFEYGRYGNPTTKVAEEKIRHRLSNWVLIINLSSALEGAETTLLMASGMYASIITLIALRPEGGNHIVITSDCYRKTRIFIQTILPQMGVSATIIDPADMEALKSALDEHNVYLFFTESPTNPYLRCIDIELVSKICHSKGTKVCIDGTLASPVNQKALALGADIVLQSATKFIGGHNDVIAGCISGSEELVSKVRYLHHIFGGVLNPNAAYHIIRGIKTLHLRVQHQNALALRMAEILEAHPKADSLSGYHWQIIRVHYPGLPSHPEHHIAKRQMSGFGGVVSFEVAGDLMATRKFIDALKIPYIAPSFGGCESFVDPPAIMSYWDLSPGERAKFGIKDNLIRFSFGVEDFEDVKSDILQALEAV